MLGAVDSKQRFAIVRELETPLGTYAAATLRMGDVKWIRGELSGQQALNVLELLEVGSDR